MYNKKELKTLVIGSMVSFFLIAFFAYVFYINARPKTAKIEPFTNDYMEQSKPYEFQEEDDAVAEYDDDGFPLEYNDDAEFIPSSNVVSFDEALQRRTSISNASERSQ